MRPRTLALLLCAGFALACSGFTDAFEASMAEEAKDHISDARDAVATCEAGKPRDDLDHVVDRIEEQLDSAEIGGTEAIFMCGMVTGGIEENGCDEDDATEIGYLYPELVR